MVRLDFFVKNICFEFNHSTRKEIWVVNFWKIYTKKTWTYNHHYIIKLMIFSPEVLNDDTFKSSLSAVYLKFIYFDEYKRSLLCRWSHVHTSPYFTRYDYDYVDCQKAKPVGVFSYWLI